jgi:hypothetical protein
MRRLLLAAASVLALAACGNDGDSRKACESRGGNWIVVGSHYEPPVYVKVGNVLVPTGGGQKTDYGCTVPEDGES